MVSLEQMTNLIALSKTLMDALKGGVDFVETIKAYRADASTIKEAETARITLSTYSDDEIMSIDERLNNCRKQFEEQGFGEGRVKCICSALKHAKDGNGGELPKVEIWLSMYEQLKCANKNNDLKKALHA